MSTAVVGPHHVSFTVSDLERSRQFWSRFGFEPMSRFRFDGPEVSEATDVPDAAYTLELLRRPGEDFILELIQHRAGEPSPPRNNDVGAAHLALQVNDLMATYEALSREGVEFVSAPQVQRSTGVIWVYARDPDGITVELLELLSGSEAA